MTFLLFVLRRKEHCSARVKLDLNDDFDFIEQPNQHIYPPSQTNCKVAKMNKAVCNEECNDKPTDFR